MAIRRASRREPMPRTSQPCMVTRPSRGAWMPARVRSSVDLPLPLRPTMTVKCAGGIAKVTSETMGMRRCPCMYPAMSPAEASPASRSPDCSARVSVSRVRVDVSCLSVEVCNAAVVEDDVDDDWDADYRGYGVDGYGTPARRQRAHPQRQQSRCGTAGHCKRQQSVVVGGA